MSYVVAPILLTIVLGSLTARALIFFLIKKRGKKVNQAFNSPDGSDSKACVAGWYGGAGWETQGRGYGGYDY